MLLGVWSSPGPRHRSGSDYTILYVNLSSLSRKNLAVGDLLVKYDQDAYGHAVFDYLRGMGGFEIGERDDGFVGHSGGPKVYFGKYRDWSPDQRKAMRYVRGKVLDIGCGAGRHSLYLQEKGFDVLGIDTSPLALKVCRLRGLRKTKLISITRIGPELGRFDTLLMLGNNFGLFASFKRARWLLGRFHKITSEKARIIAESMDPYQTDDPVDREYHKLNRRRGRMFGQVRIRLRYKRHVTPWFDYLRASKDEMKQIVERTGWSIRRFIDTNGPVYTAIIEKEIS
jgi:SAM-dependent methyltransferase